MMQQPSDRRQKKTCGGAGFLERGRKSDHKLGAILVTDPGRGLSTAGPGVAGFGVAVFRGNSGGNPACRKNVVSSQAIVLNQATDPGQYIAHFLFACGLDLSLQRFTLGQKLLVGVVVHSDLP